MPRQNMEAEPHCDFCKKPKSELGGQLIEGPGSLGNGRKSGEDVVYVCPNCVGLMITMLSKKGINVSPPLEEEPEETLPELLIPDPRTIKQHLDRFVIGQHYAKKVLSVAVANHYKRLSVPPDGIQIDKSNILMIGPTGSGKTLLARTLAKILNVPFAIGDATTMTEAGYVGEDVENLLLRLLRASDMKLKVAQRGIIYIDEIDKISRTTQNVSITRDVSGEGVQQSLLKMLEGTVASVPPQGGRKHPEGGYIPFDTTNVLFICGGTFVGLTDIVKRRLGKNAMGFHATSGVQEEDEAILQKATTDDLVEFGMIPEFIGRLPVRSPLDGMTEESLIRVLTEPNDALIKQYQSICKMDEVNLKFEEEAVREIAKKALVRDTGARALRGVVEEVMLDIMFDIADHKGSEIVITGDIVRKKAA